MGMITLTLYLNPIPSFTTMSSELLKNFYMKFCDFFLKTVWLPSVNLIISLINCDCIMKSQLCRQL